jgi:hypothetical protein
MKIMPVRVHLLNDAKLPRSIPFLQLFFAPDRVFHRMAMLLPNQKLHAVGLCEALKGLILVIGNAIPKRARDTDIECAAVAVRQNVDGRKLLITHRVMSTCNHQLVNRGGIPACAGMTEIGSVLSGATS